MKRRLAKLWDILVMTAFFAVITVSIGAIIAPLLGPDPVAELVGEWQYWIEPGDTLSELAVKHYPGRDWREVVWEIEQLNPGINSGLLQIGQKVIMPEVE